MTSFLPQSARKKTEEINKLRGLKEHQSITMCGTWILIPKTRKINRNVTSKKEKQNKTNMGAKICSAFTKFHSIRCSLKTISYNLFNNYEVLVIVRHCFKNSTNIISLINYNKPMRRYYCPHLTEEETGTETPPKPPPRS